MKSIIIYSTQKTERLRYILEWIFNECLQIDFEWTQEQSIFENSPLFKMNYSTDSLISDFHITPHSLLFEKNIYPQKIRLSNWNTLPIFFQNENQEIPFDFLAASFYLICRYEEYHCAEKDTYDRFPHKSSLAFQNSFLDIPVVDLWLLELKKMIREKDKNIVFPQKHFHFIPTYDIDIAYSYQGKGFVKNSLGFVRDLLHLDFKKIKKRIFTLNGKMKDPYNCYDYLDRLHTQYQLSPILFFLIGKKHRFNKNLSPENPLMKLLIEKTKNKYTVGIHPSYLSSEDICILKSEIKTLNVTKSRQHYIRFSIPETYRLLYESGIREEYSMGYGSINGFRASTSHTFNWFDIEKNQETKLRIFPFCFMECNSFFEQKQNIQQTTQELEHYIAIVKHTQGNFISIWHNFSLGTDELWKGWKEIYENFLDKITSDK